MVDGVRAKHIDMSNSNTFRWKLQSERMSLNRLPHELSAHIKWIVKRNRRAIRQLNFLNILLFCHVYLCLTECIRLFLFVCEQPFKHRLQHTNFGLPKFNRSFFYSYFVFPFYNFETTFRHVFKSLFFFLAVHRHKLIYTWLAIFCL